MSYDFASALKSAIDAAEVPPFPRVALITASVTPPKRETTWVALAFVGLGLCGSTALAAPHLQHFLADMLNRHGHRVARTLTPAQATASGLILPTGLPPRSSLVEIDRFVVPYSRGAWYWVSYRIGTNGQHVVFTLRRATDETIGAARMFGSRSTFKDQSHGIRVTQRTWLAGDEVVEIDYAPWELTDAQVTGVFKAMHGRELTPMTHAERERWLNRYVRNRPVKRPK